MKRVFAILMAPVLFFGAYGTLEAQGQLHHYETDNFSVYNRARPELGVKVAEFMEDLHEHFGKMFKLRSKKKLRKAKVKILPDYDEFKRVLKTEFGSDTPSFQFSYIHCGPQNAKNVLIGYSLPEKILFARLRGSAFSQYLFRYIDNPPAWLGFGLMHCFEYCDFDKDKGFSWDRPQGPIRELRETVLAIDPGPTKGAAPFIPFGKIFTMTKEEWAATKHAPGAEAWGVCHYFLTRAEKRDRDRFFKIFKYLRPGITAKSNQEKSFTRAIGKSAWRKLEPKVLEFLNTIKFRGHDEFMKGFAFYEDGEYSEAALWFEKAGEKDAENARYLHHLALCQYNCRRFEDAIATFRKVFEIIPEYPSSHFCLGRTYARAKDFDNARKHLKLAVKFEPAYRQKVDNWLERISKWEFGG